MRIYPRTLNGRFIIVTAIFLTFLLAFSIYSYFLVSDSTQQNYADLQKTQHLSSLIHEFVEAGQSVETLLHEYSSILTREKHDQLLIKLQETLFYSNQLGNEKSVQTDPVLLVKVNALNTQVHELSRIIYRYLEIMDNVESRYPGMPVLLNEMEPNNRKFSEAVELAIQEGELTDFRPDVIESDHYRVMQLFNEARYAWSMQISWFRMFVANRMGAFGDPEEAMKNNLKNREMFIDGVMATLKKLEVLRHKGLLGIQQEESLSAMQDAANEYNNKIAKAVSIYFSGNWRADLALIRNTLNPKLNEVSLLSDEVEQYLYEQNSQTNENSLSTSRLLSNYILIFTTIVIAMMLTAYFIFHRNIRVPIHNLVKKMQADSLTGQLSMQEFGNMEEIVKLVEAYDDMRNQVYNRQRRLQSILNNAAEGIITINEQGEIESFNRAAQNLFAYTEQDVLGKSFADLLSSSSDQSMEANFAEKLLNGELRKDKKATELKARRKDGYEFLMSIKINKITIAERVVYNAIVDDVTERRAAMDRLRHLAEHDSLTNLYNRQYFTDILELEFQRSKREQTIQFAVLYIDLDNFKYVNDTLGHLEGDRLLMGIAYTLKSRTRKSDILARLGGDEFALIITNVGLDKAQHAAEAYRNAIAEYNFTSNGKKIDVGCSVGVAMYEDDVGEKDALLARADLACHMAKRQGRNRIYIFQNKDKNRIELISEEMGLSRRIRDALENDGFVFNCQPMLNVSDNSIYSYELLLRMTDNDSGEQIMPSGFMESAARFGLMSEIDKWVIRHAFEWIDQQPVNLDMHYFINLSGHSIGDPELLNTVTQTMKTLSFNPAQIVFEITEDVAISDLEHAKRFLKQLHELGFKTALDDFGVGYSSFSYLRELDVDYIKIDGSFINTMHVDELNHALVKAINEVCHLLGKKTVAEFVQNQESMDLLRAMGVDYAQGYNIARKEDFDQQTIEFKFDGFGKLDGNKAGQAK